MLLGAADTMTHEAGVAWVLNFAFLCVSLIGIFFSPSIPYRKASSRGAYGHDPF